jgi:hypothetical protein
MGCAWSSLWRRLSVRAAMVGEQSERYLCLALARLWRPSWLSRVAYRPISDAWHLRFPATWVGNCAAEVET